MSGTGDAGHAVERTVLAYWRTQVSAAAVCGLVLREAGGGAWRLLLGVGAVVGAVAFVGAGLRRERGLLVGDTTPPTGTVSVMAVAAAIVQLAALAAVI